MTPTEIFSELDARNVKTLLFLCDYSKVGSPLRWSCVLEYKTTFGVEIKTTKYGSCAEDAIAHAWHDLSSLAQFGFKMPRILEIEGTRKLGDESLF